MTNTNMPCEITQEQFDELLIELLKDYTANQLLHIPGIYEILSEEFNNEVIELYEEQQNEGS